MLLAVRRRQRTTRNLGTQRGRRDRWITKKHGSKKISAITTGARRARLQSQDLPAATPARVTERQMLQPIEAESPTRKKVSNQYVNIVQ